LRWWNGSKWTEQVAEVSTEDMEGSPPSESSRAEPPKPVAPVPVAWRADSETTPLGSAETEEVGTNGELNGKRDMEPTPMGARDRRNQRGGTANAFARVALAIVAAVVIVGASFMPWIDVELPRGGSGQTTGWDLSDVPKLADVQRSDPRLVEGLTFANVDELAQALTSGGYPCAILLDPGGVPPDALFVGRGACGPIVGPPPGTPPERVFAIATPKFTVSASPDDNTVIVESYLNAVARTEEGPGLRGYGLILYGPNWSMSSPDKAVLKDAKSAIGGTLLSTDVNANRFLVADLFSRGFFTGVTTVLLGAATALVGVLFLIAVVVSRKSGRTVPGWLTVAASLVVAGLVGAVAFNWFSWITRGDGYGGVRLEGGFYLLTGGAVLALVALASFVTFANSNGASEEGSGRVAVDGSRAQPGSESTPSSAPTVW
jgi:hypothetical protein